MSFISLEIYFCSDERTNLDRCLYNFQLFRTTCINARLNDEARRYSFNLGALAHNYPGDSRYADFGVLCVVVSFDHCFELGSDFKAHWSLTITSKPPMKIHHLSAEASTDFPTVIAALKVLGNIWRQYRQRRQMRIALCLDNLVHSGESEATKQMLEAVDGEICLQDLFHVTKKATDGLKNTHELAKNGKVDRNVFLNLLPNKIKPANFQGTSLDILFCVQVQQRIRDATSYRSPAEEGYLDRLILEGAVNMTYKGWSSSSCKGDPAALQEAKSNGNYDGCFCKSPCESVADVVPV